MTLLNPQQVCDRLGIKRTALPYLRYRNENFPKPIKISPKVWRWYEEDIENFLANQQENNDGENRRTG